MNKVDPSVKRKYTEEAISHFTPIDLEEVAFAITKKMLNDNNVIGCFRTSDLGIDARTSIFSDKSIIVMVSTQKTWDAKLIKDLERINNIEFKLSQNSPDKGKNIFECVQNTNAHSLRKYSRFYYFTSCKTSQKKVEKTKIAIKDKFCVEGEIYHSSTLVPELMANAYLQKTYVQPKFQRVIELVDDWRENKLKKTYIHFIRELKYNMAVCNYILENAPTWLNYANVPIKRLIDDRLTAVISKDEVDEAVIQKSEELKKLISRYRIYDQLQTLWATQSIVIQSNTRNYLEIVRTISDTIDETISIIEKIVKKRVK